jgi:hypothetical protein
MTYTARFALAAVLTVALAGCTGPSPAAPASSPIPMGSPTRTSPLAVYYIIVEPGGPKLIREFHTLPVADDSAATKASAAVSYMLSGPALDPDYRSLWPQGVRLNSAKVNGDTTTVDLSNVPGGADAISDKISLQQLVYTVTEVTGKPKVLILKDGMPVASLLGHTPTAKPLVRAAPPDVLYGVWIVSPQNNDQLGSDVKVQLAGVAAGATITYEIIGNGKVAKHQTVTLDAQPPQQGQFTIMVKLDPGQYAIQAWSVPKDGGRDHEDSHLFTVE